MYLGRKTQGTPPWGNSSSVNRGCIETVVFRPYQAGLTVFLFIAEGTKTGLPCCSLRGWHGTQAGTSENKPQRGATLVIQLREREKAWAERSAACLRARLLATVSIERLQNGCCRREMSLQQYTR